MLLQASLDSGAALAVVARCDGRFGVIATDQRHASGGLERVRGRLLAAVASPNGATLAVTDGSRCRLRSTRKGGPESVLDGHTLQVTSVAIGEDPRWVVTGSYDKTVRVWNARTGRVRRVLGGNDGSVAWVALSTRGKHAASAALDGSVRVWSLASGRLLHVWRDHSDGVRHIAFSADGRWLVSSSDDGTACVRRIGQGRPTVLKGHADWVNGAAFSADASLVVTASQDGRLRAWRRSNGRFLGEHRHDAPVLCAGFDTEGVVGVGADQRVIRWNPSQGRTAVGSVPSVSDRRVRAAVMWASERLRSGRSHDATLAAEMLVAHVLKIPRERVYGRLDGVISPQRWRTLRALTARRLRGEPMGHLTGVRQFYGLEFGVSAGVLVPRATTETIIDLVLSDLRERGLDRSSRAVRIADICAGSGCVCLTLAKLIPRSRCTAVDISPAALRVSRANAVRHRVRGRVRIVRGNMLSPLQTPRSEGSLDYLVSNPPYVADAEWHEVDAGVKKYEPHLALKGGPDGLDLIRPLLAGVPRLLRPNGLLVIELSEWHNTQALKLARRTPSLKDARLVKDYVGDPVILTARRSA